MMGNAPTTNNDNNNHALNSNLIKSATSSSVTLDRTEFSCSDVGSSFTVTATASDTSGNQATDSVSVSVVDTTLLTVVSVGTFNVSLNSSGVVSVSVASLVSMSGDNCD